MMEQQSNDDMMASSNFAIKNKVATLPVFVVLCKVQETFMKDFCFQLIKEVSAAVLLPLPFDRDFL